MFNATGYDLLTDSFGLIDKSKGRWKKFASHMNQLNRHADEHTTYKVRFGLQDLTRRRTF